MTWIALRFIQATGWEALTPRLDRRFPVSSK
jgi:hypothetical protein